jgi:putative hydrolase of the HAD superfamily
VIKKLPAKLTRCQQARQLNTVIDAALADLAPQRRQQVVQLADCSTVQQFARRIHRRATLLGRRRPRDTQRILVARDELIMALYAAMAPPGWAIAWCDGSSMKIDSRQHAGIGGIVMDGNARVIARICRAIGEQGAFAAELAALAAVMRCAHEHRQRRLRVYTDNPGLAQLWREQRGDERLAEIRRLAAGLEKFSLKAIPRQYNQPADTLARQAARSEQPVETVRVVLFDFGGVLAEEGFRNGLVALATEQGLDVAGMPGEGMRAAYDSGFVLGTGTAADFWALMRERTGLSGTDDELTKRILDGFTIRPWMIDLVRQLHERGYVTGILSDQTHWLDLLDERDHFYRLFDQIYISFYLGKGKRDPSLFTDVASDLDMPPAAILFVDDDAGNVSRARDAGLQALQYVDQAGFATALEHKTGVRSQFSLI